jgi:Inner membrane component of T3SS, cytoplasmic domain
MKSLVFKLGQGLLRGGREFAARGTRPAAPSAAAPASTADASAAHAPRAWLHIRSGLHRGGAVALHDGRYRIGASLDDDVVLRDAQMLADHLHIVVDAQGLCLTAHAPGWSEGDAALEPDTPLELPCTTWHEPRCLLLGETRIELTWGPVASAPAVPTSAAPAAPWWAAAVRQCGSVGKPVQMAAGLVVAAGLLATFAFIAMGSGPAPLRAGPGGRDALQAAQQRMSGRAEWQHVAIKRVPASGVELRGSVERRDDLNNLLRLPEVAALLPLVRVVVAQDLRRQIQDLAGDPAIQIEISNVPAQELSAQANPTPSPGDSPVDQSGNAAAKAGAPSDARQRVVVTGKTKRPDMAASLQMLNIEFGGRVEIVDRTVYENGTGNERKVRAELPFTIASVNSGEGYIESSDGARYFEGSVVSGYRVETIEREKVVFSVNGKRISFPLN